MEPYRPVFYNSLLEFNWKPKIAGKFFQGVRMLVFISLILILQEAVCTGNNEIDHCCKCTPTWKTITIIMGMIVAAGVSMIFGGPAILGM